MSDLAVTIPRLSVEVRAGTRLGIDARAAGAMGPPGPPGPPGPVSTYEVFLSDYAQPDGTDQSANVTTALNAAAAAGKTLVVTPGTFLCHNVLVPAHSRVRAVAGGILKRVANAATAVVLAPNGSDIVLDRLNIDGNGATTGSNSAAIQVASIGSSGIWITDCWIFNTYSSGIRLINTAGDVHVLRNNLVDIGVGYAGYGIIMNSQNSGAPNAINDVEISGNTVRRYATNIDGYGMMIRGSDDNLTRIMRHVRIIGNHIDHSNGSGGGGLGIELWASNATIMGNTIRGNATPSSFGISYAGNQGWGSIVGNAITNKSIGIEAIAAANDRYVTCVANTVDNGDTGIVMWAADSRGIVADNIITNIATQPIRAGGTYVNVSNNLIDCPAAPNGIVSITGFLNGVFEGNLIRIGTTLGNTAITVSNNTAGQTQRFTVTGNEVISAATGVSVGGSGGSTAIQIGTIVGNDLSATGQPIAFLGSTTKSQVQRWANTGIKPIVSGSRAGNAALADLLGELAGMDLITDQSTA